MAQSKYGGIAEEVEAEEVETLEGRSLVEIPSEYGGKPIPTDPASAIEFVQAGLGTGEEIPREPGPTPFPMEPGTSRAAKELPEMAGLFAGVHQFVDEDAYPGSGLVASAAMVNMTDPEEIAMMMKNRYPDTVGIQYAPDGTLIIRNTQTGAAALINRPGISAMDVVQTLGIVATYAGAGKLATIPRSLTGRLAVGATASGLTEDIVQRGQELAGGQYDPLDVMMSTSLGPLAELGRPAIGLVQNTGKFIGSYLPRNWFGGKGLEGVIPEAKKQALRFAKGAGDFLESGRKAVIMTQDALAETMKPYKMILLKMVERLPFTGTGGLRAAQREQRIEILRNLSARYGLNPNTNYGKRVIDSLNENAGAKLDAAHEARTTALEALGDQQVKISNFTKKIGEFKNAELEFGEMANTNLIKMLDNFRSTVWQGGKQQDYGRSFGKINDFLERLYLEATNAPPATRETIEQIADALNDDLIRAATDKGGSMGAQWAKASATIKNVVMNGEKKTLDAIIEAGEVDQGVLRRVLKANDPDQLKLLRSNLSPEGMEATRQMIIRNALKVGGWRRGPGMEAPIDAQKVSNWFETDAVENQMRTFFPGKKEQEMFLGMQEYLRLTAEVQKIGKGTGMAAAMGTVAMGAIDIGTIGVLGALGRTYQSAPMRNLLLRLHHIRGDKRQQDRIMEQIEPYALGVGRRIMNDWTESDPHDHVYIAEDPEDMEAEEALKLQGKPTIDDLRQAVGVPGSMEEAQEAAARTGQRLMEMLE